MAADQAAFTCGKIGFQASEFRRFSLNVPESYKDRRKRFFSAGRDSPTFLRMRKLRIPDFTSALALLAFVGYVILPFVA